MFSWCTLALIIIHYLQEVGQFAIPNCLLLLVLFALKLWAWAERAVCVWMAIRMAWCSLYSFIQHSLKWPLLKLSMSLKKNIRHTHTQLNLCQLTSAACSGWNAFASKNVHNSYYLISTFRVDFLFKEILIHLSCRHTAVCCVSRIDYNLDYRIVFNAFISLVCCAVAYNCIGGGDHWHHGSQIG